MKSFSYWFPQLHPQKSWKQFDFVFLTWYLHLTWSENNPRTISLRNPREPETEFLRNIVDIIYNKLNRKQVYLPANLTGMDPRVEEINSWLKHSDAQFLAICGMGGSGKTTLAKCIVYSNWKQFENISIIEDIGSRCKEPHNLLQLQEKLFADISEGKNRKIPSVCEGTFKIEEALQMRKALVVLDDIVEPIQLVALLGHGNINKQSKIIITTRENNAGKWFGSRSWKCQEYKMKLLNDDESLELLSLHAFQSKIPMEGYKELAQHVVQYCEGNPLALEVLGASLLEDNSIQSWKSALNLLEKEIHSGIYSGGERVEGLALDMPMLADEDVTYAHKVMQNK
ncbi:hypothetical protein L2E82_38466 [Cichorium intybus]|uniref:Uncharacterized protein n=1 Tax=Cichorium intybus TaxID=13427 RepID=A0ACB9AFD5_CICIN|nr:hypothetical protein L2E82_38466 [Cichorium intybus]